MARIKAVMAHPSLQSTCIRHNSYLYTYYGIGTVDVYCELDAAEARLLPPPDKSKGTSSELQHVLHEHMRAIRYWYDGQMLVVSYRYTDEEPFGTTEPHTTAAAALVQLKAALHQLETRAV
jgi:hypothetical protein